MFTLPSKYQKVKIYTAVTSILLLYLIATHYGKPVVLFMAFILLLNAFYYWPAFLGSWYIGLKPAAMRRIFSLAEIKPKETFYDIGSGDGRVVIEAARRGMKAKGIEIEPLKYMVSLAKIKLRHVSAEIKFGNFYHHNFRDADVVFMWLPEETVHKMEGKLKREMRKGSRIITHEFPLKTVKPYKADKKHRMFVHKL